MDTPKGAFTGADKPRKGVFEQCKGGTIVLDDINQMPEDCRGTLLQVLEEHEVQRLGAEEQKPTDISDVVVIATSNEDMSELCQDGKFREDLYQRLSQHKLQMPPLHHRITDVPLLVKHFLAENAELYQRRLPISLKCSELAAHRNFGVRELSAKLARLQVAATEPVVEGDFHDSHELRILEAIKQLFPNGEKPAKAKVAAHLKIKSPSTLSGSDGPYGQAWRRLEREGKIPGWPSDS